MNNFQPFDPVKFEAFCWYHMLKELQYPIVDFHRELIGCIVHPNIAIAAPRNFAKSSYFSYFYPIFALLEKPGTKIVCISATGNLAESWVYKIRTQLETNPTLKQWYGDQVGTKWTTEELQLKNGSVIQAKGYGKQVRGFRPDIIIGDDLETEEMVSSKEQCEKFDHWFWTDLMGTRNPDTQTIIIGTILDPESFLNRLIRYGRHEWQTRFYQAIKKDGTALWPERWSVDILRKKELEMGSYPFAQEYMNDPIPAEARTFQEKWIKEFETPPLSVAYFTTVDPAIEIGDVNDFTAIVTCAVDSEFNLYVVECINRRMLPSETIDEIFGAWRRWHSSIIGIETMGFQKMLKFEIDRKKREKKEWPIITELKSNGRRKALRIEGLQPYFEAGKVFIKKGMDELRTQLLRFPSPRCHDDLIDALAYQLDIIRPAQKEIANINPDCFAAVMERRRKKHKNEHVMHQKWGNQKLRKIDNCYG